MSISSDHIRSGLPRVPGGEPWPPDGIVASRQTAEEPLSVVGVTSERPGAPPLIASEEPVGDESAVAPESRPDADAVPLRRGLPRVHGGSPWPPEGRAPAWAENRRAVETPAPPVAPTQEASPPSPPAATPAPSAREPREFGRRTLGQWARLGGLGLSTLIVLAAVIVLAARGVTTLPGVPEFMRRYPGEYEPAVAVEEGFPAWARWSHYLNFFFMVLIVRTGLLVRHQQKPPAFYTPKRGGKKVSIYLWLHTSIDLLWLANGLLFVILLFATGHWARIVPTSWEVFPNAASALIQYLTLEWPTEHGWVNYNSLQQLMYFVIVFIAAPLAAATGVRMSAWWPQDAETLDRLFPAPLARALHYPTMLFFVFFVIIHVFLVFTTGALRNLNHMYAGNDGTGWFGFWMFVAGLVVVAGVWLAARPIVLAPIANLFGKVNQR